MLKFIALFMGLALASPAEKSVTEAAFGVIKVDKSFPSFGGYTTAGDYFSYKSVINKNNVVVVSYFASWCEPCKHGIPVIEKVAKDQGNVTIVYIGVEKDVPKISKFASQLNMTGPIVVDKFKSIAKRHSVVTDQESTLPKTFVIKADGTVSTIFTVEGNDFEKVLTKAISSAR